MPIRPNDSQETLRTIILNSNIYGDNFQFGPFDHLGSVPSRWPCCTLFSRQSLKQSLKSNHFSTQAAKYSILSWKRFSIYCLMLLLHGKSVMSLLLSIVGPGPPSGPGTGCCFVPSLAAEREREREYHHWPLTLYTRPNVPVFTYDTDIQ